VFKIQAKENNQFWHFDGGNEVLKVVSSLVQPNDDYVKFTFEKQTDDLYKIKVRRLILFIQFIISFSGIKKQQN
jgi:hypothetical protein